MLRRLEISALLILVVFLAAPSPALSEDLVVFDADFTGDTVDDWPDVDLPGDPATDSMWYYSLLGESTALVHSSFWELGDKPLVVTKPAGSYIQVYMSFDPDYLDCSSYTVTFDAMAGNPLSYAYFTFIEEGLRPFASIGLADDPRLDVEGQGPIVIWNSASETSVRWYEADAQAFRLEFDLDAGTFDLFVDEVAVPEAQAHPLAVGDHDGTFGHMALKFGGTTDAVMAIDNLHVVAHCGQVDAADASWGSLKALW